MDKWLVLLAIDAYLGVVILVDRLAFGNRFDLRDTTFEWWRLLVLVVVFPVFALPYYFEQTRGKRPWRLLGYALYMLPVFFFAGLAIATRSGFSVVDRLSWFPLLEQTSR